MLACSTTSSLFGPQAREGAIEEGSSAWNDLSKGDKEKRLRASKEKALKLRSPNYFVSATRLSLRNLPYSLDEKALKALLTDAVSICREQSMQGKSKAFEHGHLVGCSNRSCRVRCTGQGACSLCCPQTCTGGSSLLPSTSMLQKLLQGASPAAKCRSSS